MTTDTPWKTGFLSRWAEAAAGLQSALGRTAGATWQTSNKETTTTIRAWKEAHAGWIEQLRHACPAAADQLVQKLDSWRLILDDPFFIASYDSAAPAERQKRGENKIAWLGEELLATASMADGYPAYLRLRAAIAERRSVVHPNDCAAAPRSEIESNLALTGDLYSEPHENARIRLCPTCGQPLLVCWVEVRDDNWRFEAPVTVDEARDLHGAISYDRYLPRRLLSSRPRWVVPPSEGYFPPNDQSHWEERDNQTLGRGGEGF